MPSFDIACKLDAQEIDNAVNQTRKEVGQRFDFKGCRAEIHPDDKGILLIASDDYKLKSLLDVLASKLTRRQIPLEALTQETPQAGPEGSRKQYLRFQEGIPTDKAKEIVRHIKDTKMKVQAQIQGEQVRVTAKKIDDLQSIIQILKQKNLGIHMQFTNMKRD